MLPRDQPAQSHAVPVLWAAYIAALPFHRLWRLPWFDLKLQPPEIVFPALAVVSAVVWWRDRRRCRLTFADRAVAGWVGANVIALLLTNAENKEGLIETLGAVYLAGLYAAVRITATPSLLDRFGGWFGYSAMTAAVLGIAGVIASSMGFRTQLAVIFVVPYLGLTARAQAFTAGPGMLSSILLMAIPLFVAAGIERRWRRRDIAIVLLLVLGLVATVSKTTLCLVAALTVMWACGPTARDVVVSTRIRLWTAVAISTLVALVIAVGTHVMVVRDADVTAMTNAQLVGGQPLALFQWHQQSWALMRTTYALNNEASVLAVARSWPIGVGPAGQPVFTKRLQHEGRFPQSVWMTTPHSTYFGTAAERGVLGVAALVALLTAAGSAIRRLLAAPARLRWEAAAYAGVGTGFLIEALTTDLLNCRHYWMLLAVVVARQAQAVGSR